jgi:hypothetical protein
MVEGNGGPRFAYVAEGKLYAATAGEPAVLVDSPFVQTLMDRVEKERSRNDWKAGGMAWNLGAANRMAMPGAVAVGAARRVQYTGVTGSGGDLYYVLDTDYVGGLFHHETSTGFERRLFHRNGFRATDLARRPSDGTLALSVRVADGTAHLATFGANGRGVKQLTDGDAVDEAPSWAEGEDRSLVFQSAGIARNGGGARVGLSPYAVHKLDLDRNEMTILAESDDADLLLPRAAADGTLHYVRRPYQPVGAHVSPWRLAMDFVLFPYRLLRAIGHFLNFFSLMFSRQPLISTGGPPKDGPDARMLMLWGRVIDANKALRAGPEGRLVPASWELVRRSADGRETVLAKHVLWFDRSPDGAILYTDGSRIWHLPADGAPAREVGRGKLVERVVFAG